MSNFTLEVGEKDHVARLEAKASHEKKLAQEHQEKEQLQQNIKLCRSEVLEKFRTVYNERIGSGKSTKYIDFDMSQACTKYYGSTENVIKDGSTVTIENNKFQIKTNDTYPEYANGESYGYTSHNFKFEPVSK